MAFEDLEKNPGKLHYETLITLVITIRLTLMIMHVKPKAVNVLEKLGLFKPIFNKKNFDF